MDSRVLGLLHVVFGVNTSVLGSSPQSWHPWVYEIHEIGGPQSTAIQFGGLCRRRVQLHRLPNSWVPSAVNVPARTGLLGVPDPLSVP